MEKKLAKVKSESGERNNNFCLSFFFLSFLHVMPYSSHLRTHTHAYVCKLQLILLDFFLFFVQSQVALNSSNVATESNIKNNKLLANLSAAGAATATTATTGTATTTTATTANQALNFNNKTKATANATAASANNRHNNNNNSSAIKKHTNTSK